MRPKTVKCFVEAVLTALFLGLFALPGFAQCVSQPGLQWSGPPTSVATGNGRNVIRICESAGRCTDSTPFFLGINAQTEAIKNGNWDSLKYEAQLQLNYLGADQNGVVPMLQVNLLDTSEPFLTRLAGELKELSPRPYLIVRFYLQDPPPNTAEPMFIADLQGRTFQDTGRTGHPLALGDAWISHQKCEVKRVLSRLDAQYPERIIGVQIAYENGGEWFFRPSATDRMYDWGDPNWSETVDGITRSGMFPWTNDSGSRPGPVGRHYFTMNDYSATAVSGFCGWSLLPESLSTDCRSATVGERNNSIPGLSLPETGKARGVFLEPSDINSLRAAYYNRYQSSRNVDAITQILAEAKTLTGNRILTAVFYGYLHELGTAAPISGHTELTTLLNHSAVDIVAGPYSYRASRYLGNPVTSTGPSDAPQLSNKLWFDEDDTRTHLASDQGFKTVATLWDSVRILKRNLLTAGLRGRGSYFLDLSGEGWFGRPAAPADSEELWANLHNAFTGIAKLQLRHPSQRYDAQVAVFIDDLSLNYVAGLTPAGEDSYSFATDVTGALIDDLGRLGTPVKQYLLSDLLKSNLDLGSIKFAVIANAFNIPANLRSAINARLKTPGRTVLFMYGSGYLNETSASTANISSLTEIPVSRGTEAPVLAQTFNVNGRIVSGGPGYPLTPWFKIGDTVADILGTYTVTGEPSLARKSFAIPGGTWTSIVAAAPKLPLQVLRKLSEDAGVHHFVAAGDVVEAAGNMMFVHAAASGVKSITFPQTTPRIVETAIWPSDSLMCRNCVALPSVAMSDGDTRVFRWTSAPLGNFESIRGTSLEGWAADLDQPATSLNIAVYFNGGIGTGTHMGEYKAALPRPDLTQVFDIPGNNGFSVNLGSCPSGAPVSVYAIDPELENGDGNSFIGTHICP